MDVDAIIARARVPIVERVLEDGVRATVGDVAGRRTIIVNRNYQISSDRERRWILAEGLGHVLLDHRLANSDAPGRMVVGRWLWRRPTHQPVPQRIDRVIFTVLRNVIGVDVAEGEV